MRRGVYVFGDAVWSPLSACPPYPQHFGHRHLGLGPCCVGRNRTTSSIQRYAGGHDRDISHILDHRVHAHECQSSLAYMRARGVRIDRSHAYICMYIFTYYVLLIRGTAVSLLYVYAHAHTYALSLSWAERRLSADICSPLPRKRHIGL
eukprot:scaffold6014_cov139-Isochrysis_galbana.AAC.1